jgi:hypothetical protein
MTPESAPIFTPSPDPPGAPKRRRYNRPPPLRQFHQILIDCRDERDQKHLYEQMKSKGYQCRLFTL